MSSPPPPDPSELSMRNNSTWLRVGSCGIAVFFFFSFIIGPYRRWQTNPAIKFFLAAASATAASVFTQISGVLLSYDDMSQLYLVWIVFLGVANESAVAATAYSIYNTSSERIAFEIGVLTNNLYVAFLIGLFPIKDKFHRPLWALWCLTVAKMFQRILSFRAAARTYGPENVDLVAHLMAHEHHEDTSDGTDAAVDPSITSTSGKEYYNYCIQGEEKVKYKYEQGILAPMENTKHEEKVVTIDKVWNCKGRLLDNDGSLATRLKDICLSFALFKLLRRRYRNYPAEEEGQRKAAKRLVLEQLLKEDDRRHCDRTFRVIQGELEFLHDLFHTKYPINFYRGISVLNILQLFIIVTSIWTATWALQKYTHNPGTAPTWGKNSTDFALTIVFAVMIIAMELWEFANHLLSNWSKVLLTCNYVRHHRSRDRFHLDKLVGAVCWGSLWRPLSKKMGQYSLFESYKLHSINRNIFNALTWVAGDAEVGTGAKRSPEAKVSGDVKYAIFRALRNDDCCISNGERSLRRNGVFQDVHLFEACGDESFDRKILVWHIATSFFELEMAAALEDSSATTGNKINKGRVGEERPHSSPDAQVAICLSKYCAYLLTFAPDLLPLNNLVVKFVFKNVMSEAQQFFRGDDVGCYSKLMPGVTTGRRHMYAKMKEVVDGEDGGAPEDGSIMNKGLNLARQLKHSIKDEGRRWKVLAEFWAEFLLYLAPSDNAEAHRQRLSNGGEFITHLWVLLYNAGIIDRPGLASAAV